MTNRRNAPIMVIAVATEGHSFREGQAADKETNEAVRCRDHPTNFQEADFWITRRGSLKTCGKPTRQYNPEHIGVKVERTDLLLPDYLFLCFEWLHSQGIWEPLATGTLELVNIRVSDVRSIVLNPR